MTVEEEYARKSQELQAQYNQAYATYQQYASSGLSQSEPAIRQLQLLNSLKKQQEELQKQYKAYQQNYKEYQQQNEFVQRQAQADKAAAEQDAAETQRRTEEKASKRSALEQLAKERQAEAQKQWEQEQAEQAEQQAQYDRENTAVTGDKLQTQKAQVWRDKQSEKNTKLLSDHDYFMNRSIYTQYMKAKQRLDQIPITQRPWSNEYKLVQDFEKRYKRYFGKDVDKDSANFFYNDYSLQNVENGDIPAIMTELANKWYGKQIESMADQYAGAGLGTADALMAKWKQDEHGQGTLRKVDIPVGVTVDEEGDFVKGPMNMKEQFKDLLLNYYRCVAYREYLEEMIRNGQASAMVASTGANDELKYWDELIQELIPADLADYESEINEMYSYWSKFAQAVVTEHDNSLKFKDISWTDKGGGHGSGFRQLPADQPSEQQQSSLPSASSSTGTGVPEAAIRGASSTKKVDLSKKKE